MRASFLSSYLAAPVRSAIFFRGLGSFMRAWFLSSYLAASVRSAIKAIAFASTHDDLPRPRVYTVLSSAGHVRSVTRLKLRLRWLLKFRRFMSNCDSRTVLHGTVVLSGFQITADAASAAV